ncbi:MAG: AraC family transcriptional regulator [Pseudomonadota bacterium]
MRQSWGRTRAAIAIAYACGFSSQAHMTSLFGKYLNTTPGKLRQTARM